MKLALVPEPGVRRFFTTADQVGYVTWQRGLIVLVALALVLALFAAGSRRLRSP